MRTAFRIFAPALLAVAALSACHDADRLDGDDGTPLAETTTVSGIAATGAAISGGAVALHCGNGFNTSTTSASDGAWTASVPGDDLPCAVQVSGGTVNGVANTATFYSIALAGSGTASTANLTPVGDLALASAVNGAAGTALETWFATATDAQRQQAADGLAAAITALNTAFTAAGYTLPEDFNPFTAAIVAGGADDAYDLLLEAYRQALADAGQSYDDARGSYIAGGGLPTTGEEPVDETPDTTLASGESGARFATTGKVLGNDEQNQLRYWTGTGSITVGSTAGSLDEVTLTGPEANRYLNFRNLPDTVGTHDCGYGFNENKANIELGFAVDNGYNTIGIRGANGSFTQGFRCSITITKVGARNGGNYEGTIEGSIDAQLYKTGQQVNVPDSLSVKGHFRLGTPASTEPEPPVPTEGAGILGEVLKEVLAGDYVLKCQTSFGQPVQSFAFSIKPDGSSTFKGAALVDATHPGTIQVDGWSSSSVTVRFAPEAASSDYVVIGFKSDGSFYPNSVHSDGSTLYCFYDTTGSAPAAAAQFVSRMAGAVGALARAQTLNSCEQGTGIADQPSQPESLSINRDGSTQFGSQNYGADAIFKIIDNILFGTEGKKIGIIDYARQVGGGSLELRFDKALSTIDAFGVFANNGSNTVTACKP